MSARVAVPDPGAVVDRIRDLLGPEAGHVHPTVPPRPPVARPRTDEETAAVLRVCREEGWRVLPEGAGIGRGLRPSGLASGNAPAELAGPDLVLSTLGMAELLEHEPADLMARARAGVRLSTLQEAAARERQWLALNPPGGSLVTLGGVVASGTSGPLRVMYGRPRDQLLGLNLVDGDGRRLVLGGRVVKNVAGFDLVRLTAGSRGALGVITEVTFRLHPVPEVDGTLLWSREDPAAAWKLGRGIATLPLPIASVELLGGRWGPPLDDPGFRVLLRLMGSSGAVAQMRKAFVDEFGPPLRELEGAASADASRVLSERDGQGALAFRAHTLPDRGEPVVAALKDIPWESFAQGLLGGSLRGTLRAGMGPGALAPLKDPIAAGGGVLAVLRAPGAVPEGLEVGRAASTGTAELQARITRGFDPAGILPGAWREGWA